VNGLLTGSQCIATVSKLKVLFTSRMGSYNTWFKKAWHRSHLPFTKTNRTAQ